MALYRVAGLTLEINPRYSRLAGVLEKYKAEDGAKADFCLDLSDEFLEEKHKEFPELSVPECEYFYTGVYFSGRLLERGGFVLHSSAIEYENNAYVFSADSGTGKSTHVRLWQKHFGKDKTKVINDDKPAIKYEDGKFRVYGTPFSGKDQINTDVSYPIKALCFLHRSAENEIRRITPDEAIPLLLKQTLRPRNEERLDNLLVQLDKFLKEVPCYSLGVNMEEEAAAFAYREINK